jgi:hypothetical protein
MKSVIKMKLEWFFLAVLVLLPVVISATQIHNARGTTTRSFTLYGAAYSGWGFTATDITSPGPTIQVEQGDTVNLTLISSDGIDHRFFVSYTNHSSPSTGDPESPDFTGTQTFEFTATNTVGTYKYYCVYHPAMWGYFQVVPTGTIPEFGPAIMLPFVLAGILVAALVYHRKRQK